MLRAGCSPGGGGGSGAVVAAVASFTGHGGALGAFAREAAAAASQLEAAVRECARESTATDTVERPLCDSADP